MDMVLILMKTSYESMDLDSKILILKDGVFKAFWGLFGVCE